MSVNDTPFCERNTKMLVISLALYATIVLAYSIWSALHNGRVKLTGHHVSIGAHGSDHLSSPNTASPPNTPVRPPAARQVAFTNTYSQFQPWMEGTPTFSNIVNTVNQTIPMGGIIPYGWTQVAGTNTTINTNFTRAADIIRPCVVNINAIRPSRSPQQVANLNGIRFIDPFDGVVDKFFGELAFESIGSGVIVHSSGYVVTNHHVVGQTATIILTRFQHEEQYNAQIVASDHKKDLALLKIRGNGPFPVAELADSNRIEVGDWVMAVGNPFGLENTVTVGVVSGKRNSVVIGGVRYKGLIQTDAPINRGSSGGPLVNINGQVVGLNTAIYAPTGVFNGTGFAIPSNQVGAFVARFMENDNIAAAFQRPLNYDAAWLGIQAIDMTPNMASKLSYPYAGGVYVSNLTINSPADGAEIARGDIIMAVNGMNIENTASMRSALAGLSPGQVVTVTTWRGGKTLNLRLQTRVHQSIGR